MYCTMLLPCALYDTQGLDGVTICAAKRELFNVFHNCGLRFVVLLSIFVLINNNDVNMHWVNQFRFEGRPVYMKI